MKPWAGWGRDIEAPWGIVLARPRICVGKNGSPHMTCRTRDPKNPRKYVGALTEFGTPRGRPVHPACEGWLDRLPPYVEEQVIFDVAARLGGRITAQRSPERTGRVKTVWLKGVACDVCGSEAKVLRYLKVHLHIGPYYTHRCSKHVNGHLDEWGVPWRLT